MLKVEPIEKVMKKFPNFKPSWKTEEYGGMNNPDFGRVNHVAVCGVNGTPFFDQYSIEENPGAIILPYDRFDGIRIGLIEEERHIPGKTYINAPRGFAKSRESETETAYRELFEETGIGYKNIKVLGRNNSNTTFFKTDDAILITEIDKIEKVNEIEGKSFGEKIKNLKPYKFSQIIELQKQGLLECSITKATILEFGCYEPEFFKY